MWKRELENYKLKPLKRYHQVFIRYERENIKLVRMAEAL